MIDLLWLLLVAEIDIQSLQRVNGRIQEAEVEVSMNELREQLLEILRNESAPRSPVRPPVAQGGLRTIKSATNVGVKDSSIFPTHIHDGRPLPAEKTAYVHLTFGVLCSL